MRKQIIGLGFIACFATACNKSDMPGPSSCDNGCLPCNPNDPRSNKKPATQMRVVMQSNQEFGFHKEPDTTVKGWINNSPAKLPVKGAIK